MSIRLSIIIPVFNAEQFLRKCLESIVSQTCQDFECILIDDGSSDSSMSICNEYAERYGNIVVIHQNNKGVSAARNVGLSVAQGEFVTFVDADDYIESMYVEFLLQERVFADLTFFGFVFQKNEETQKTKSLFTSFAENRDEIESTIVELKKCKTNNFDPWGYVWNKMFRLSIIKKEHIIFQENLSLMEDYVFTNTYAQKICSIRVVDTPLYLYRQNETGLMARKRNWTDLLNVAESLNPRESMSKNEDLIKLEWARYIDMKMEALVNVDDFSTRKILLYEIRDCYRQYLPHGQFLRKHIKQIISSNTLVSIFLCELYVKYRNCNSFHKRSK